MKSMEEFGYCPKVIQEVARLLTKKTRLGLLDWARTVTRGEEGYRERISLDNKGCDFWINIRKKEGVVKLSFYCNSISGVESLEYYDGSEQDAIKELFASIAYPDDRQREALDHHSDSLLVEALLKKLR